MGIKKVQKFTLISKLLRKNAKNSLTKKLQAKKGCKLEIFLFYTTNLQKFLTNKFFGVHFFSIISTDLKNQREILRILDSYIQKKKLGLLSTYMSIIWN
jgi:hypothetical protein